MIGVPLAGAAAVASGIIAAVMFARKRALPPIVDGDDQLPFNVNNAGAPTSIENPVFNQMDTDDPFDNDFEEETGLQSLP